MLPPMPRYVQRIWPVIIIARRTKFLTVVGGEQWECVGGFGEAGVVYDDTVIVADGPEALVGEGRGSGIIGAQHLMGEYANDP